jgi:clan AA aspartic protease (TIGR02281 family)
MLQKIGGSGVIISLVALTACNSTPPVNNVAASPLASSTPMVMSTPLVQPSLMTAATVDAYPEALNAAAAAQSVSGSAITREDWSLVANQWQNSVKLLQSVPKSSTNYLFATKLLPQYQQNLSQARQKSVNFKEPIQQIDKSLTPVENSRSFSIPIVKKLDGIPVIEVTFNGQQKFQMLLDTGASRTLLTRSMATQLQLQSSGKTQAKTASGISEFDIVQLQSVQFGQGLTTNIAVSVGKDDLNYGLLGHDVYQGYDITLKEDVILFNKR